MVEIQFWAKKSPKINMTFECNILYLSTKYLVFTKEPQGLKTLEKLCVDYKVQWLQ